MELTELRVAVVDSHDPEDVTLGSGWSSSLTSALSEVVGEVVPIHAELPRPAHRLLYLASMAARLRVTDLRDVRSGAHRVSNSALLGRSLTASRRLAAWSRLRRAGTLSGVVQRGCDMLLPRWAPVVTFEDSTLLQAVRSYPWPHLQGLRQAELDRYAARQRRIYHEVRAACVSSHWAAESVVEDYGVDAARVHVVGLGKNHELGALPRDFSTPRFLFVGVAWERKNGPAVLRAFARVRERWPQARLDVVGGHPRLQEPGVTGHGSLSLGDPAARERLAALYASATVFVMPSLHEPTGTVYAEAVRRRHRFDRQHQRRRRHRDRGRRPPRRPSEPRGDHPRDAGAGRACGRRAARADRAGAGTPVHLAQGRRTARARARDSRRRPGGSRRAALKTALSDDHHAASTWSRRSSSPRSSTITPTASKRIVRADGRS